MTRKETKIKKKSNFAPASEQQRRFIATQGQILIKAMKIFYLPFTLRKTTLLTPVPISFLASHTYWPSLSLPM